MSDIGEVQKFVHHMAEKGATVEEIDEYVASSGYTAEDIKRHSEKPEKPEGRTWSEFFTGEARDAGDEELSSIQDTAVREAGSLTGMKQSPEEYWGEGAGEETLVGQAVRAFDPRSSREAKIDPGQGSMTAVTDAAQGDIWEKTLTEQGRFVSREKDSKGREIITFKGDDGQPKRAYVNKPEWDMQDVNKIADQAAVNVATAIPAGRLAAGAGVVGRAAAQGLGQYATEIGRDVVAQNQGSKQGIDETRAVIGGAGGAAGELIGPMIARLFRGNTGEKIVRKLHKGEKLNPTERKALMGKMADDAFDKADKIARDQGQPLNKQAAAELRKKVMTQAGKDLADIEASSKGLTSGQITGDEEMLKREVKQRKGGYAKDAFDELDADVDRATVRQVIGDDVDRLSPGENVQGTVGELRAQSLADEKQTWKMADDLELHPELQDVVNDDPMAAMTGTTTKKAMTEQSRQILSDALDANLGSRPQLDGHAASAYAELKHFVDTGGKMKVNPELSLHSAGRAKGAGMEALRRRLLAAKNAAAPGDEASSAAAVYRAFDDWVDGMAEEGLIQLKNGKAGPEIKYLFDQGRKVTRKERALFSPGSGGLRRKPGQLVSFTKGKEGVGKLMDKLFDEEYTTPAEFAKTLFGRPGAAVRGDQLGAVKKIVEIAKVKKKPEITQELRKSYLLNLVLDETGKVFEPERLLQNLEKAMHKNPATHKALGITNEIRQMATRAKLIRRGRGVGDRPAGEMGLNVPGISIKMKVYRTILGEIGRQLSRGKAMKQTTGGGVGVEMGKVAPRQPGRAAAVGSVTSQNALMGEENEK